MNHYTPEDWQQAQGRYWTIFFNTISGPRSVFMIGSENKNGIANIGLFNSLVHIGAKPPLMGFILRPTTVPRHTYQNISDNGVYTINHVSHALINKAHQTSAKYNVNTDEFDEIGITKEKHAAFSAPFVKESPIKLGLKFIEEHTIRANSTRLIIGEVKHVIIDSGLIASDGYVNTALAETTLASGLDAYHTHKLLLRKPYAKP